MKKWMKFFISLLIPLAVGMVAGFFTSAEVNTWYQTINKPTWQPPGWLFGPVWTTLYIMMGIAFYLVWKQPPTSQRQTAIILFIIQLIFNFFWSFIFFSMHEIGWALAEIFVMWVFIFLTIVAFSKVNKVAAWLLVPYISWVTFASILNYTIWQLNQ